ncbi:MAG: hypothetical protein NT001_06175 [Candidatus Woesearchaeota archaeon]|nr:hypothetical protein [Candidatus Woesearchaeota archaeon]
MEAKEIDKYLKNRIKDMKGIEAIKGLISKKDSIALLDIEDIKAVLDNSKGIHIFSGDEDDFAKRVKEPHKIKSVVINLEAPEDTSLDIVRSAIGNITDKMDKDVRVVWGAKINEKAEKITFTAVLGY